MADAEVVSHVGRDDNRRVHHDEVPDRPGRQNGGGHAENDARVSQRPPPLEPRHEPDQRQDRQEQKRYRADERGQRDQHGEQREAHPAQPLFPPTRGEEDEEGEHDQEDEQRLGQERGRVIDQVWKQRQPQRGQQPHQRIEQTARDLVDEGDGGDAEEHLEERVREHQVLRDRCILHQGEDRRERGRVADRIVGGCAVRQRVPAPFRDRVSVAEIEDRIVNPLGLPSRVQHPHHPEQCRQDQDGGQPTEFRLGRKGLEGGPAPRLRHAAGPASDRGRALARLVHTQRVSRRMFGHRDRLYHPPGRAARIRPLRFEWGRAVAPLMQRSHLA